MIWRSLLPPPSLSCPFRVSVWSGEDPSCFCDSRCPLSACPTSRSWGDSSFWCSSISPSKARSSPCLESILHARFAGTKSNSGWSQLLCRLGFSVAMLGLPWKAGRTSLCLRLREVGGRLNPPCIGGALSDRNSVSLSSCSSIVYQLYRQCVYYSLLLGCYQYNLHLEFPLRPNSAEQKTTSKGLGTGNNTLIFWHASSGSMV